MAVAFIVFGFFAESTTASARDVPLGQFRNTYYYMAFEADYPGGTKDTDVRAMDDTVLAKVTPAFYKALLMEGSGRLKDGRTLNWVGRGADGFSRFHVTKLKWGRGTGTCALSPFRTIAADPAQIPAGAIVHIAETVGMTLPDGTKSDGVWRAEDTGTAILHDRIDIFIGRRKYAKRLQDAGITHMEPLTITLLSQPLPDSCVFKNPE